MGQRTCFLIDDDEDDREIFEMALRLADASYTLKSAKNGVEALKLFDESSDFTTNYIFVDLNMPYMTGNECLAAIKQIPRMVHVPVIIYTTSSSGKDAEDALALGATHFLVKPSSIGALTLALTAIFKGESPEYFINSLKAG
jgi:CheY-like chemotaxis protein